MRPTSRRYPRPSRRSGVLAITASASAPGKVTWSAPGRRSSRTCGRYSRMSGLPSRSTSRSRSRCAGNPVGSSVISASRDSHAPLQARRCPGCSAFRCAVHSPVPHHAVAVEAVVWLRAHVQRADALRTVELVPGQREQVHAEPLDIRLILPAACVASVCTSTPYSLAIALTLSIGWSVPISLFATMSETRTVSLRKLLRRSSRSICPASSTPRYVTAPTRLFERAEGLRTAGCSVVQEMMWPGRSCAAASPRSARLFASVAPLVKMISAGRAPNERCDLASSSLDSRPRPVARAHAERSTRSHISRGETGA